MTVIKVPCPESQPSAQILGVFRFHYLLRISLLLSLSAVMVACEAMPITVRVLYGRGGKGDGALNDDTYRGILDAREKIEGTVVQRTPNTSDEMGEFFAQLIAMPYETADELIVVVSDEYNEIIEHSECQFGNRKVLHIDGGETPCSNVTSYGYRTYAAAFQAGVASMTASSLFGPAKNKKALAIGGSRTPAIREAVEGFAKGVEFAGGSCVISYMNSNLDGFDAPGHGQVKAESYFRTSNPDVVFAAARRTNQGILEACKSYGKLFVGFESDSSAVGGGVVIGSVLKRVSLDLEGSIIDFYNGNMQPGHIDSGISNGATAFVASGKSSFLSDLENAADAVYDRALELEAVYLEEQ